MLVQLFSSKGRYGDHLRFGYDRQSSPRGSSADRLWPLALVAHYAQTQAGCESNTNAVTATYDPAPSKVTLVSPLYTTRRVRHKGKMSWKTFIQKESPTRREHLRSASSQTVRVALLLCRRVRNGRKKEERSIKEGRDEE